MDTDLLRKEAKKIKSYPVLIVDHGDNTGSGGSADDMSVLAEMLRQGLSGIIVAPIRDPEAVDQLINCGEGNEMTLTVGGKYSVPSINQIGQGLNCTGVVKKITTNNNDKVKSGDLLVLLEDTDLLNSFNLAKQSLRLAETCLLYTSPSPRDS